MRLQEISSSAVNYTCLGVYPVPPRRLYVNLCEKYAPQSFLLYNYTLEHGSHLTSYNMPYFPLRSKSLVLAEGRIHTKGIVYNYIPCMHPLGLHSYSFIAAGLSEALGGPTTCG